MRAIDGVATGRWQHCLLSGVNLLLQPASCSPAGAHQENWLQPRLWQALTAGAAFGSPGAHWRWDTNDCKDHGTKALAAY
jgi:hypothetical protein